MSKKNEGRCKYCGQRVLWLDNGAGRFPVNAALTPWRRAEHGENGRMLFTNEGGILRDVVLTTDEEAQGYAHEFHFAGCRRPASRPRKYDTRPGMREWRY